jgi:hypothetical protein
MKKRTLILIPVLLVLLTVGAAPQSRGHGRSGEMTYRLMAREAKLNREVTGPVMDDVHGVPAKPVDSFVHDGVGSEPVLGFARYEIDPVNNEGKIMAKWRDEYGVWRFTQTVFAGPDHASGLRVDPGPGDTTLVWDDPIPVDVYLHGDTTAGGPVLPTLFNHLATWGEAEVTLNGKPFENPYDGPAPLWVAHTMTSVGARNSDGQVLKSDGMTIFEPGPAAGDGYVDYDDLEFHLVFHDAPEPNVEGNFPPPFSFFYHLTFEDVRLSVKQND